MFAEIKSEFRKLLTIRSTYILSLISSALIVLIAFYFNGYKGNTGSPSANLEANAIESIITGTIPIAAVFVSIIAVLFMAHEYRYNTIMYTLTANAHRTQVFVSKALTIMIFSIVFGLLSAVFTVACYMIGLALRDASLPAQNFDVLVYVAKIAFYFACHGLVGYLLAALTRSLVGAIAALFLIPTMIEPMFASFLKDDARYLPFGVIDSIMGNSIVPNAFSPGSASLVAGVYLFVFSLLTWLLFSRRDAV
jgi:ABC-2 type transport system permease protein